MAGISQLPSQPVTLKSQAAGWVHRSLRLGRAISPGFRQVINRRSLARYFEWRTDYYLDLKKNADRYRAVSPVHFADRVRCPILLFHGRGDTTVEISQTNAMADALRAAHKSVTVVKDAAGVHGLPGEQQRREFYGALAKFVLDYAPPDGSH